jgi:hypothetical protein
MKSCTYKTFAVSQTMISYGEIKMMRCNAGISLDETAIRIPKHYLKPTHNA